jgi:hypothetical protein
MFTVLYSDLWDFFNIKIDEICKIYNFTKEEENPYEIYSMRNDKYKIIIYLFSHPQYQEIELQILITNIQNETINQYIYVFLSDDEDEQKVILSKPINEFINEMFMKISQVLHISLLCSK